MKIINVPKKFQPGVRLPYPPHSTKTTVDEYVGGYISKRSGSIKCERAFLPIHWTPYQHITADYGRNAQRLNILKGFCSTIREKCWTIHQYDDGALAKIKDCIHLSAGGVGDIPIPLTCSKRNITVKMNPRLLCSFVGSPTHPIREELRKALEGQYGFHYELFMGANRDFVGMMIDSTFSLCPRGYGRTSFRMYEAIEAGSIPVYVSDVHWLPYTDVLDWDKFCVIVKESEIGSIVDRLRSISQERIAEMRAECIKLYDEYFSLDGVCLQVERIISKW
jgi:hypothetical protein